MTCSVRQASRRAAHWTLALTAVYALGTVLRLGEKATTISHSIVSLLLWWAFAHIFRLADERMDRQLLAPSLVLGALFSVMLVLGANVVQYETANLTSIRTWAGILCAFPALSAVCALAIKAPSTLRPPHCKRLERLFAAPKPRTFFLICWALLFLCWLPGLIASYPGIYAYDSAYQLAAYLRGAVTTQHPMIHTGWLALCVVEIGGALGSYEAGLCVYSISQMLLFAAAHASILAYLRRRGANAVCLLAALLVFAFWPTNAIFSISATKDVAFSAFFIWTLIAMLEGCTASSKSPCFTDLRFLASAFGMMIFRNQGVYVFALSMLIGLIVMKGQRKRIAVLLTAGLMMFGVYQGPITALVGVQKADAPQEMLSVPIMQLARVRSYYDAELSETDKEQIEAYLPDWDNYSSLSCAISDPVKNTFNVSLFREAPARFFKLWLRIGAEHPAAYIDAFLRLTVGYWYPDMDYRDWPAYQPYYQYEYHLPSGAPQLKRSTPAALQWLNDLYLDLSLNNSDQQLPVLSLLTSAGLAAWILLLFIGWAVYHRRWRTLWPSTLLLGLWGTLLLGPVVLMRYALPLLMAEGLLIGTACTGQKEPCCCQHGSFR